MKGLVGGIPIALLAAAAHAQAQSQVIGVPSGPDVGGAASFPTKNEASSAVKDEYNDNHSFDLDSDVHISPPAFPQPGFGHWKRKGGEPESTVIGGPSGPDVGNSADIPTVNTFSSEVTDEYNDNHSFDVDATTIIKPPHYWRRGDEPATVIGGPSGPDVGSSASIPTVNEFSSEYTATYTGDHHVDVDSTVVVKPHKRTGPATVIGGPSGPDVGNAADIPTLNSFSSTVDDTYNDDHHFEFDSDFIVKPHKRTGPAAVIGGPSGPDVGNAADIPTSNSFSSTVDETYNDDHHIDFDSTFVVKPHYWKARAVRPGQEDATVIGGPSGPDVGNSADISTVNTVDTAVSEAYDDDHHVDVDSTAVIGAPDKPHWVQPHYEGHGEKQPAVHGAPQAPAPAEAEQKPVARAPQASSPAQGECTKVQQVVHTITSTRTAVETHTAMVYPHEAHGEKQAPASSSVPVSGTPANTDGSAQSPDSEPVLSSTSTNNENAPYPNPFLLPGASPFSVPAWPSVTPQVTPWWFQGSQLQYPGQPSAEVPAASVNNVAEEIPVYVPTATSRVHGSVVASSMSSPGASSASRVAVPTGASAEHNKHGMMSASPSPSPSPPGALDFTGAAGRVVPAMGACTILAGAFAVLAFVL
ncbi:hypothetical protein BDV06DRAFT_112272 [Aspergillus oleicola]